MILKTFIIVVLLAGFNPVTNQKELMVFPQPVFDNADACFEFVQKNRDALFFRTWQHYGVKPIEQVFCAPEDEALRFIKPQDTPEDDWTDGIELPPLKGLDT